MATKPRSRSTTELRAALAVRSGGDCEIQQEGCQGQAVEPCHRIGTGMGGVHGAAVAESDRLSNTVHGCRSCGRWQHDHEALAKAYGQILSRSKDPLREPILLRYGVVFLDDEGGWTAYRHEMRDDDSHRELAEALHAARATVVVSGYPSDLYDRELYAGWDRHTIAATTGQGGKWEARTEVLWSNAPLGQQLELFPAVEVG